MYDHIIYVQYMQIVCILYLQHICHQIVYEMIMIEPTPTELPGDDRYKDQIEKCDKVVELLVMH